MQEPVSGLMRLFRGARLRLNRSERTYIFGLGSVILLFCAAHSTYQLWLSYSDDMQRASQWVRGSHDLGASKLQTPILREASFPRIAVQQRSMAAAIDQAVQGLKLASLPLAGLPIGVQFAGVGLPSNSELSNYMLLHVKQELQRAGAQSVRVHYPTTTFKLGSQSVADGYQAELDNVLMPIRDAELAQGGIAEQSPMLLLQVREAGVDTEDRSVYSQNFYMRVALLSGLFVFVVGAGLYLVLERYWPGHGRRAGVISTLIALAAGWNVVMLMFINLPPDQRRFNVVHRVDLKAFLQLNDLAYDLRSQGQEQLLLGVPLLDQPQVLGMPKVMAPGEGGVVQIIPAPVPAPGVVP